MSDARPQPDIERYQSAIGLLTHEGENFWHQYEAFALVQTIIGSFVLTEAFKDNAVWSNRPGAFIQSLVGLVLAIIWFLSQAIEHHAYYYRREIARGTEPDTWNLLVRPEQELRERMPWVLRRLRGRYLVFAPIVLFGVMYAFIAYAKGPWQPAV